MLYQVKCFGFESKFNFIISADTKEQALHIANILCANKTNSVHQIYVAQVSFSGQGDTLFKVAIPINDLGRRVFLKRWVFASNKNDAIVQAIATEQDTINVEGQCSTTIEKIYTTKDIDRADKNIDNIRVYWILEDKWVIFDNVECFEESIDYHEYYYNFENNMILQNNMLVGALFGQYQFIDEEKLRHWGVHI